MYLSSIVFIFSGHGGALPFFLSLKSGFPHGWFLFGLSTCNIDHSEVQAKERIVKERLKDMLERAKRRNKIFTALTHPEEIMQTILFYLDSQDYGPI